MNNTTKITIATIALTSLLLAGVTHLHTDVLPMLGVVISYVVALGILALAGLDNKSARRLF